MSDSPIDPLLALAAGRAPEPPPQYVEDWIREQIANDERIIRETVDEIRTVRSRREPGYTRRLYDLHGKHTAALGHRNALQELLDARERGEIRYTQIVHGDLIDKG